MRTKLISMLALFAILSACGQVPEKTKEKPTENPDEFSQVYEETLKPANGISSADLADWKRIDNQMQALVPSKAALFNLVLHQTEVSSVASEEKRQANLKLNGTGKSFLADLQNKCWVFDAAVTKSTIDANTEKIRGALGLTGDICMLGISETQETKRTVVSRTNDAETFTTVTQQEAKIEVKNASVAASSGFTSSTNSMRVLGSFLRYPRTSYKYASAKVKISGTFNIQLTSGETIAGTITGESKLGPQPATQYLLEGTSGHGVIRLIIKRSGGVTQYFFNGTAVNAATVPSFLNLVDDYLQ
jgi:hypothetical protein